MLKLFSGIVTIGIIALILAHGFFPDDFTVDSTTVALVGLLVIVAGIPFFPQLARHVRELTIMGNTVKFRKVMDMAEEQLEVVTTQAEQSKGEDTIGQTEKRWPGFITIGEHLYRLIDEDPRLAVAGLGIEMERVLWGAARRLARERGEKLRPDRSLQWAIDYLLRAHVLHSEQAVLLKQLVDLRNLAVHGREITEEDARRFFGIVEELNDSVSLGYSPNFAPNEKWEEQGLICKYEHCIEHMPLHEKRWAGSCGLFGQTARVGHLRWKNALHWAYLI
jgi:hypothetical protein